MENSTSLKTQMLTALGFVAVFCLLCLVLRPQLAHAAETPVTPLTSAQELANVLNADAPAEEPNAEVSEDGVTVTLLSTVEITGDNGLEIAVPEGQAVTLDLATYDLTLENGTTTATTQLLVSGSGTFALTGSGGTLISQAADGELPAIQVTAGIVTMNVPVQLETPAHPFGALRITGGTLVVGEQATITGSGAAVTALVRVDDGTLELLGTITATGEAVALVVTGGEATLQFGFVNVAGGAASVGIVVQDEGVCTIDGTEVDGRVQAGNGGVLTIADGHVEGAVENYDGTVAVTVDEDTGMSASFGEPVAVDLLQGVGALEYEFGRDVGTAYFRYFATAEGARADAAQYPTVNWATASDDAYICMNTFADNGAMATEYYNNFYRTLKFEDATTFEGPTMMNFVITRPGLPFTFTYRDGGGNVVYQEAISKVLPDATITAPFFNASLPGMPDTAEAEVGVGDYTLEITALDDPSVVYSTSQIAISKVTIDPNGGTYSDDYATVKYLMQGAWSMSQVPVREGYALTGWTSTPMADMVTWDAEDKAWYWVTPKSAGDFTFTAQWAPEVVEVSRLWNPYNGAHLLSTDANEITTLSDLGWKDEGVVFSEYGYAAEGSTPISRLYNPYNGDHLYSTSEAEVSALTAIGWQDEGVKFYGSPETDYPVYRLWNSHQTADGGLGSHLWTTDKNEYDTLPQLPPVGAWQQEGSVWYAVSLPANGS